ncbi:hypothetical protein BDQ94DRAFT_164186 [Aspergillus welwitschiae]|uniref:Zn(2)-C6 fungal-type domain-containing protein n=1 Tax=Aspergillus welwitschiae TaxID=1341132 RepID=A0A3F3PKC2_9EURO|nr:hypothetical protein BDQ94DRAFT_164186 [Aspergillus welwitschiae]RDH26806.1 hypothetical protein BDQ94DRAFT_164186 [Aspergillus welwitschiae]
MNKETSEYPHRQLLPKASLGKVGHSHSPVHAPSKRRSFACTNCRRKHIKCTGPPSCETCVHSGRTSLRHAEKATERYRNALVMVIQTFKSGADQDVRDLVDRIKQSSSVDDSLAELQEMTH